MPQPLCEKNHIPNRTNCDVWIETIIAGFLPLVIVFIGLANGFLSFLVLIMIYNACLWLLLKSYAERNSNINSDIYRLDISKTSPGIQGGIVIGLIIYWRIPSLIILWVLEKLRLCILSMCDIKKPNLAYIKLTFDK